MEKVLVVEDSERVRYQIKVGLGGEYQVLESGDYAHGMELFEKFLPHLVVLDVDAAPGPGGGSQGFRSLEEMLNRQPSTKVVLITGYGQRAPAYRAISCGAYDYCSKPVQVDDLRVVLRRAQQLLAVESEKARLQKVLLRMMSQSPLGPEAPELQQEPEVEGERPLLTLREARDMVERGAIMAAVDTSRGNLVKASEILGVCRPTLYDLMKKHGLHKSTRQVWRETQDLFFEGAAGSS